MASNPSSCLSSKSNPTIRQKPPIHSSSTTKSVNLTLKNGSTDSRSSRKFSVSKETKEGSRDLVVNSCSSSFCPCCPRRHFLGAVLGTGLLPVWPSFASDEDPMAVMNRIHPPRADWYEEFYALAMEKGTKSYEAEIAGYKSQLFANLKGKANKILEIGIGTGPNLKYYADYPGISVFGVDPNRKMQKYAQAAAEAAGVPQSNFKFLQGVAESLPVEDASVDAVIGTLILCSVTDVDQALQEVKRVLKPGGIYIFVEHVAAKDGSLLRLVQGILDPLQQSLADGCHLTRNTATNISRAGFEGVDVNQAVLSAASFVNPHVYGIAYR